MFIQYFWKCSIQRIYMNFLFQNGYISIILNGNKEVKCMYELLLLTLFRFKERIRNLNNEISDLQKSKRHIENESFHQFLTENSSLNQPKI